MARVHKHNKEIEVIAHELSKTIYVNEERDERWRASTESEKGILYDIFVTALETLNFYHSATDANQRGLDDGVVNMAEFMTLHKLPYANSYITTYCPLKQVLRNWETE